MTSRKLLPAQAILSRRRRRWRTSWETLKGSLPACLPPDSHMGSRAMLGSWLGAPLEALGTEPPKLPHLENSASSRVRCSESKAVIARLLHAL